MENDLKFEKVLGEGRSKVYLVNYQSQHVALNTDDIIKCEEMLPELMNEVSVYKTLSDIQGNGIPKFCFMAMWNKSCIVPVFLSVEKWQNHSLDLGHLS